jgi:ER-bound oxygenase mpaB/B'/Rubber oxygenase, catalytic domain
LLCRADELDATTRKLGGFPNPREVLGNGRDIKHLGFGDGTLRCAAGTFDEGSFYCANEASALRWVHATLIETALMAYALVLPPLSEPQRERYFEESLVRHSSIVAAARLAGFFRVYRNNAGVRQSVCNPSSTRHCASSPQFSYAGDLPCVDGRASAASAA